MGCHVSLLDYCQFLLASPNNFTLTYFAEHSEKFSHDQINRYLSEKKFTPAFLWEHVKKDIILSDEGYIIFDDEVLDKRDSQKIEMARFQYSGNVGGVVKGIGVVTCVYFNPKVKRYWAIDYRIYDPDSDGKSKLVHVYDMLNTAHYSKKLPFKTVLMDSWYATHKLMLTIDAFGKIFYCAIKSNRLASKVDQKYYHIPVKDIFFSKKDLKNGIRIHLNRFPNSKHLQLFRITINNNRTEHVLTNDLSQSSSISAQKEYGYRWMIEQLHREEKQITGIEKCQCRRQRIQRNHIACAFLVWNKLKNLAYKTGQSVYMLKNNLFKEYLIEQLKSPSITM